MPAGKGVSEEGGGELAKQMVRDLQPGQEVRSVFLVTRKEVKKARTGAPYLSLELMDKSGRIEAKVWDGIGQLSNSFSEKDFILVVGRVESFRDTKQVVVSSLRKCREEDVDLEDFIRTSELDPSLLAREIREAAEEVKNPYLRELLGLFLEDGEFMRGFVAAPAAKNYHHPYRGGLLEHTAYTVRICRILCDLYPQLDRDLLLSAAILHDIGKIRELEWDVAVEYTDEGRFLGHLVVGDQMIRERIATIEGFPPDLSMRLRHAVLSHHGELEWGSPKRPKTLEALVLHHVDNLDAKINSFLEVILRSNGSESSWTDVKNLFRRPLYVPRSMYQEMEISVDEELGI
jgi:3'-5' exoribonuclease